MQPLEYRSVRYWSKEINGTLPGGQKRNFFIRGRGRPTVYGSQLADCCFNFVVMWRFVNQSVGATNRHLAKREYVSLDLANEIRDTAVEVLRGVRARVSA